MPFTPGALLGGLRIDLGPVSLGMVDTNGVAWSVSTLEGWDSPDVRTLYSDRQADHGAWAGPTYLGPRVITLTGTIVAPDQPTLEQALEQLRAAVAVTDTVLTVWEAIPKQATVRRSGRLLIKRETDRIATYSVLVTAANPRRYATVLQSGSTGLPVTSGGVVLPITPPVTMSSTTASGAITAPNAGMIGTRPVLTITGPVASFSITVQQADGTFNQLQYSDSLGDGDVLVLDCDAHTAVLNNTASRRRYLSGPWPEIPPGGQISLAFRASAYSPTATLTATWRSAWL